MNRSIDYIIDGTSFGHRQSFGQRFQRESLQRYERDTLHRILNNNNRKIIFFDNNGEEFHYEPNFVNHIRKIFKDVVSELEYGNLHYREFVRAQSARNFALHRLDCFFDILTTLSCRQLTGKVVTDLPREIRDLVYASILNDHDFKGRRNTIWSSRYTCNNVDEYTPLATSDPEFPPKVCRNRMTHPKNLHCWLQTSCGVAFVGELAEMSYQNATSKFTRYGYLSRFLGLENPPTSNSAPTNDFLPWKYVANLVFRVSDNSSGFEDAMENMPLLRKLGRKARIEVIVPIQDSVWGGLLDTVDKILEKYGPLFLLLNSVRECGHQVLVHLESTSEYQVSIRSRKTFMTALPPPLPDMERLIEEKVGEVSLNCYNLLLRIILTYCSVLS